MNAGIVECVTIYTLKIEVRTVEDQLSLYQGSSDGDAKSSRRC